VASEPEIKQRKRYLFGRNETINWFITWGNYMLLLEVGLASIKASITDDNGYEKLYLVGSFFGNLQQISLQYKVGLYVVYRQLH